MFVKPALLVSNLLPKLAKESHADLHRIRRNDLAEEIAELRILDRCQCGSASCRTFYCRLPYTRCGAKYSHLPLKCGVVLGIKRGHIASLQIVNPTVSALLDKAIP